MGYIITLVVLVIVVPLLFLMLGRKPSGAGTLGGRRKSGGVTPSVPSSDEPTPGAGNMNQAAPNQEKRLPPG